MRGSAGPRSAAEASRTGDGEVKLLDFGIAKLIEPDLAGPHAAPPTLFGADYALAREARGYLEALGV